MTKQHSIRLFEAKKVRSIWDEDRQEWYFSVVDVVQVLTDSVDPKQYVKKMRTRDLELNANWGTICTLVPMLGADGKMRRAMAANMQGIFRIIQSIPSSKAEPFKLWIAQVAAQRLDQMQDPELSIDQAMVDYKRLGYSDNWINQRIRSIEVRKELTDEWSDRGVNGMQYATLTDIITHEWSGHTTRSYKQLKGLKKENLRDNMTNLELALNTLAEAATTEISKQRQPDGFTENASVAKKGGGVAKVARQQLEQQLGRSVISPSKASDYLLSNDNESDVVATDADSELD